MLKIELNGRIIMDGTNKFASYFNITWNPIHLLQLAKDDSTPSDIDEHNISLGGWIINVKSTVFSEASGNEIVDGWNHLAKSLSVNKIYMWRLFRPIFCSLNLDYHTFIMGMDVSPDFDILVLLRLCYWYYKCYSIDSFSVKENEIRAKLQGSINMIERPTAQNLQTKINVFRNTLNDCISELMFASLTEGVGRTVSFDGIHDLVVEGHPAEVKTIHDAKIILDDESFSLTNQIIEQVTRKKWSDHIGKAIRQGGRIIFISATFSPLIQGLNASQLMDANKRLFSDILYSSINSIIQDNITHLPVIVTVSAMYYDFLQSHFTVRAPITAESGKIDLDRSNSIF